ncbi:hypothetical protein BKA82DRAFT_4112523 [Pisolithus tinctorius]|nr:hypothetical protein BKA82DRAFT_4112523 [Pisolithus tinctorius]
MSVGIFPSRWGWGICVAMSATIVFGFFALSGGQRVQTTKPDGSSKTYHCLYDTTIQCPSGAIFPAQLRIYSPFHDTPLADDTIAFVLARADAILLEASNVVAVPGDPSSEEYESRVPDSPWPYLVSSDYVRDANMTSTVVCTIDSSHPRWRRTPVPNQNSMDRRKRKFMSTLSQDGETTGIIPPEKLSPTIECVSSTASEHARILLHPGVKVTTNITFEEFLL